MNKEMITLTFGDVAENHVGMEQIGKLAKEGFSVDDLTKAKELIEARGGEVEIVNLNEGLLGKYKTEEAIVLIVRNGLKVLCGVDKDELMEEQRRLDWDRKAFMRGRVVNKKARYNLCYGEEGHEPDYESKKGRVVAYDDIPLTRRVRDVLPEVMGEKAKELSCEGNYYYDVKQCGIGFHGDGERKKVMAVRLGASLPLHFKWYHRSEAIGEGIEIMLNSGDMYVMSSKAVGNDWMCSSKITLRHATGSSKYVK